MNELDFLKRNIKNYMIKYNLNDTELSQRIGKSRSYINMFMNGHSNITFTCMVEIAKTFDTTVSNLLSPDPKQYGTNCTEESLKAVCDKMNDDLSRARYMNDTLQDELDKTKDEYEKLNRLYEKELMGGIPRINGYYRTGTSEKLVVQGTEVECSSIEVNVDNLIATVTVELDEVVLKGK